MQPWHVHFLLNVPLPFGRFFLRSTLRQISSSSLQMRVCLLAAADKAGLATQMGKACSHNCGSNTGANMDTNTHTSDGNLNSQVYETSHNMAKFNCYSCLLTARTIFMTIGLQGQEMARAVTMCKQTARLCMNLFGRCVKS